MGEFVNLELLINASVFKNYLICLGILVIKMMLMSPLTTRQRIKHKQLPVSYLYHGWSVGSPTFLEKNNGFNALNEAYISEEDAKFLGGAVGHSNPDVERVRRAHLNDLESIPIFLFAAFAYMCIDPPAGLAIMLFRIFTAVRIIHTVVYAVIVLPQPARGISWLIGYLITGYMALQTIMTALFIQ